MLTCAVAALVTLAANSAPGAILSIVNPSFEDQAATGDGLGGFYGWSFSPDPGPNGLGVVTEATPDSSLTPPGGAHDGNYFVWGRADGAADAGSVFQRIDVSSFTSAIDSGNAYANLLAYGVGDDVNGDDFGDFAQLKVRFFDEVSGGAQLGSLVESDKALAPSAWTEMRLDSLLLPGGTRSIEIILTADRPFGSFSASGFDDVSGSLTVVPEPASAAVFVGLILCGVSGAAFRRSRRAKP